MNRSSTFLYYQINTKYIYKIGDSMKKNWQLKFGIILILSSAIMYLLHFTIFADSHHIFLYLIGDIAFVPIEVLLVTMIIHKVLETKEKKEKMEKLHMLVGVFYSETGKYLLSFLYKNDIEHKNILTQFNMNADWSDKDFDSLSHYVMNHQYNLDIDNIDLDHFAKEVNSNKPFLITMLQNPILLEHDSFTDLIKILFHLDEEFSSRFTTSKLLPEYKEHIKFDIERAYRLLVFEWVAYMKYLHENFPNLFAFSIDTNPFTTER